mmetsp:Transcript_2052/g.6207  ORF Transcript_2052/g.6207 Transcript_2052/m.6207 type:complete len:186 (+) Transcript_2052:162-719(+)
MAPGGALDLSRETLQQGNFLGFIKENLVNFQGVIKENLVNVCLGMFAETDEMKDDSKKFSGQSGKCLNFGMVGALDLSRATLQQNNLLGVIKENLVNGFLGMCAETDETKDDSKKFSWQSGKRLKFESPRKMGLEFFGLVDPVGESVVLPFKKRQAIQATTEDGPDIEDDDKAKLREKLKAEPSL